MKFGNFELHLVSDGGFKLDGGAMFGVIPKVLWQKTNPPNEFNRIALGLNCLLIKSQNEIILFDTGIGNLYDDKFAQIFEIDKSTSLLRELKGLAIGREDVTRVVLTHLHFDHCGGNCMRDESGKLVPTFPNATYYFQKGEFEYAQAPDSRSKGSYLPQNWQPVVDSGQLQLLDGNEEIVSGIEVLVTGGHTRDHQVIKIKDNNKTSCFLADLVPTDSHLRTPYVMGYDLYPKTTMEVKENVLQQALAENWLLLFEHAPQMKAVYLLEEAGKLKLNVIDNSLI